jgi:hypothetical protein
MKDAMRDLLRCPDGICQVFNSEPCLWFRPLKTGHSFEMPKPHAVSSSFAQSCGDLT